MAAHSFKIRVGETTCDASIELDGKELTGVRRVTFDLRPNDLTTVMLEIVGEVVVEGEFKEDAIIQVRQPT